MSKNALELTDQKVLNYAEELLEAHLPLEAEGYCCTRQELLNVLLGVAVNRALLNPSAPTSWARRIRRRFATISNDQPLVDDDHF